MEQRARVVLLGIVSILALACSNTPIDAILPLDAGLSGNGGAPPTDCSEPVSAVVPGLYNVILDETDECLALGDETLIAGTPATGYEATLAADCTQSGALFRLQTGFQLGFELRNVESNLSLDIEAYESSAGTRAVLYVPTNNPNQRFYISRVPGSLTLFSIAPVYVRGLCLTATTSFGEMQIWPCEAGSSQAFRLVRTDCE